MKKNLFYLLLLVITSFGCSKENLQASYDAPDLRTSANTQTDQNKIENSSVTKISNSDKSQPNVETQCYERENFEVKSPPDLLYRETCSLAGLPKQVSQVINKTAKRKYKEFVVEETIGIDKTNPHNPKQRHYLGIYPKDENGDYSYSSGEQWSFVQTKKGWRPTD